MTIKKITTEKPAQLLIDFYFKCATGKGKDIYL
jgi:hypothetical protein